jgi:hypothetical protein
MDDPPDGGRVCSFIFLMVLVALAFPRLMGIESDLITGAIVELGRAWAFMRGHQLRVFHVPPLFR